MRMAEESKRVVSCKHRVAIEIPAYGGQASAANTAPQDDTRSYFRGLERLWVLGRFGDFKDEHLPIRMKPSPCSGPGLF